MLCRNNFSSKGRFGTELAPGAPSELDNLSSGHPAAAVPEPQLNGTASEQRMLRKEKGKEIRGMEANGDSSSGTFSFHRSKDTRCCSFQPSEQNTESAGLASGHAGHRYRDTPLDTDMETPPFLGPVQGLITMHAGRAWAMGMPGRRHGRWGATPPSRTATARALTPGRTPWTPCQVNNRRLHSILYGT